MDKRTASISIFFNLVLTSALLAPNAFAVECNKTFDTVLQAHTNAIDARDLRIYLSTLAPREDQLMILPDGSKWESMEEIENGHREWFKDASWKFNKTLIRRDVRPTWGIAVYLASVDRPEKSGDPFLLSLMFAPEGDGCWYLQHDQNTLVEK